MENSFKEADIEILISTMNRDSLDFLVPMFPFLHFSNFSILIVNQTEKHKILTSTYSNVRVINSFEKGLSKSRNLALENAVGKILVIADDDVIYQEGFISKIMNTYNKFPKAAVINFCAVNSDGNLIKKYPLNSKNSLSSFDVFNTSSIEMTVNKAVFDDLSIRFDANFGLGATFGMGEEAVFLFDLKRKQQQLVFEPEVIVKHEELTSSDKKNAMERYYIQGALFTRIFKYKYLFWIIIKLFFDLKQNKLKLSAVTTVLKSANQGRRKFKTLQIK